MDNRSTQLDDPSQPAQAPQPPKSGPPVGLIVGIAVGCAVLVLLFIGLITAGILFSSLEDEVAIEQPGVVPEGFELQREDIEVAEPEDLEKHIAAGPSEVAALAFAVSRKPEWPAAEVTSHSEDWRTAEVVIGPSPDEYGIWMTLAWNEDLGSYELSDEGPIAQEKPEYEEEVPDIYQPGEQTALEAALMDTPDWVGKVVEHSVDWKSVTVWVGEPYSEWSAQVKLRWNDAGDYYDIVATEGIPYP